MSFKFVINLCPTCFENINRLAELGKLFVADHLAKMIISITACLFSVFHPSKKPMNYYRMIPQLKKEYLKLNYIIGKVWPLCLFI